MFRRVILVILVVLAVVALVGAIGAGFHHAGYWGPAGGHMMRYGPGYWGYGRGFFPGLFLFPVILLLILAAVLWRPWHHHWRYGYGPGPYGPGPYGGQGGPRQMFEEWHRQAHAGGPAGQGGTPTPPGGGETWPGYGAGPTPGQGGFVPGQGGFVPGQGAPTPPSGGTASPPPAEPPTPPQAPGGGESAT